MSFIDSDKNIKIQIKARLRVPSLLKSEKLKINNSSVYKLLEEVDNSKKSSIKKNKDNNYHKNNYLKYIEKTSLLKKLMSQMPIKEIYSNEKDCSIIYDNVYKKIMNFKKKKLQNLPKIVKKKNSNSARFINSIKLNGCIKHKKNLKISSSVPKYICRSTSAIMSSQKISSYRDKNNNKKINKYLNRSNDENKLNTYYNIKKNKNNILNNLFLPNKSFSIIKGGGIKYNYSIFRHKNINDLI